MSTTPINLGRGTFTTTSGTILYTAATTSTILTDITLTNPSTSSTAVVSVGLTTSGVTYPIYYSLSLTTSQTTYVTLRQVLTSGQSIVGNDSLGSTLYQFNGIVIS